MEECTPLFGAVTFFAKKHPGELCGSNGLPLTPNSISIYGRGQLLKSLVHPNLCEYLDIIRGHHERVIIISEYYKKSLKTSNKPVEIQKIKEITKEILSALKYLHSLDIVVRLLSPSNILLTSDDSVKLFNFGLYHMTNCGQLVAFPIGDPKYMAPEVYIDNETNISSPKVDIWSLGIILLELVFNVELWRDLKLGQIIRRVLSLIHCSGTVLEKIINEHNLVDKFNLLSSDLQDFLESCLNGNCKQRLTAEQLLKHEFLQFEVDNNIYNDLSVGTHVGFLQRLSEDNIHLYRRRKPKRHSCVLENGQYKSFDDYCKKTINELSSRSLKEQYYLWQLAGGDVNVELKKHGLVRTKPPILSLPNLVLLEGTVFGEKRDMTSILSLKVVPLPMDTLHQRLSLLPFEVYYPLIETKSDIIVNRQEVLDSDLLPLVIRERDIEYQFHRIVLFHRLLLGYPYKKDAIVKEATKDIPPLYRGDVWAALLGVAGDFEETYVAIDKETPNSTDRQIEVDIPRCHQYNELLSSSEGHKRLKRVLKAWVISHPEYVYWQGLDSLCAPFLYLNFNREAQAYACLSAFIPKYLNKFFLQDNSCVIHEYLAKFKHLIAFHDPVLANHLDSINFQPELFTIPWFLTVFSHVFPLHKIFHLWDKLLLGDASFPLFVGLSVLGQLRDTLITSGFNECILLFSDLPEINIERCVQDSLETYNNTPRSITQRKHELSVEQQLSDKHLQIHPPLEVEQLQREFCPRISAADFLYLLDVNKYSERRLLSVDIRSYDDYNVETVPDSINIPFNTVSLSDYQVPSTVEGSVLLENKGKIIVVISSGGENFTEFGRWLVECGFPKVCLLHGGIQVLKNTGVLCLPV